MTRSDHLRRTASVVLVLACLVLAPAVAEAKFSGSRSAGLSVGTSQMVAPTGLTGSYVCSATGKSETLEVTVKEFTDGGPTGSTYDFGLAFEGTIKATASSSSMNQTLEVTIPSNDGEPSTWTVGVRAARNNWTSGIGTVSIVCPKSGKFPGSF